MFDMLATYVVFQLNVDRRGQIIDREKQEDAITQRMLRRYGTIPELIRGPLSLPNGQVLVKPYEIYIKIHGR